MDGAPIPGDRSTILGRRVRFGISAIRRPELDLAEQIHGELQRHKVCLFKSLGISATQQPS
jgi:hypothetical protein